MAEQVAKLLDSLSESSKKDLSRDSKINDNTNLKQEADKQAVKQEVKSKCVINRKPFELVSWHPTMYWQLDLKTDTCTICRNSLMEKCISCIADGKYNPISVCLVLNGKCGHSYHDHCITQWVKTQPTCPVDMQPWEIIPLLSTKI